MTEERRMSNMVNITDTLWKLNKYRLMKQIRKMSGVEVPEDCYDLIEVSFRTGAALMGKALGKERA